MTAEQQNHVNNFWQGVSNSFTRRPAMPATGAPKLGNISRINLVDKLTTQVPQKNQHSINSKGKR